MAGKHHSPRDQKPEPEVHSLAVIKRSSGTKVRRSQGLLELLCIHLYSLYMASKKVIIIINTKT